MPVNEVIRFNERELLRSPTLEDRGLLESALARPHATFGQELLYPYVVTRAAVLLEGIAKNHPFSDANKRTSWWACMTYLATYGIEIGVSSPKEAGEIVVDVVNDKRGIQSVSLWLVDHMN